MKFTDLKFWLYLLAGGLLIALVLPLIMEGQEPKQYMTLEGRQPPELHSSSSMVETEPLEHETVAQFTIEEKMSVKDKQVEYWRLQAQAASILLQASNLQMELNNEVMRLQSRCVESGGKFDPGAVSCIQVQVQEGK